MVDAGEAAEELLDREQHTAPTSRLYVTYGDFSIFLFLIKDRIGQ